MEVKAFLSTLGLIFALTACSNTPELETGEIRALKMIKNAIDQINRPQVFVDARNLITREKIDTANIPVLFVELGSGQSGTLTPYPKEGIGTTWLGADGATITLDRGVIKASRGLGDDIMGSNSNMPLWSDIGNGAKTFKRELGYLNGENKISKFIFQCKIRKNEKEKLLKIWDTTVRLREFEETCNWDGSKVKNIYYLDTRNIVRKSYQYHSESIGYINFERLDRL